MKVLRVFCIIFLIIGLLVTMMVYALKVGAKKEYDSLGDLKADATETEVLKSKVTVENGTTYITLKGSGDNKDQKYTLEKYTKTMKDVADVCGTGIIICGVFDAVMVAGIVGTTVAVKKKKEN